MLLQRLLYYFENQLLTNAILVSLLSLSFLLFHVFQFYAISVYYKHLCVGERV